MSDDSFIREVEEELRNERMKAFWDRWGKFIIGGAVLIVVVVAAWRSFEYYQASQAASAGDAFMEAVDLAETGKRDAALAALGEIQSGSTDAYRALAGLRAAAELAEAGKVTEAIAAYDSIVEDSNVEENFRSIARLRAGFLLVDEGGVSDVQGRVGPLTAPAAPYRSSAREALALAHYKAGDLDEAARQLKAIVEDEGTPNSLRQRAILMADLIVSQGGPQAVEQ